MDTAGAVGFDVTAIGTQAGDHGLGGDTGTRRAFMQGGRFGPTETRAVYAAGGVARVTVKLTTYHAMHFEFRLADLSATPEGDVTQAALNKHVLEIAETTPNYPRVLQYQTMKGMGYTGHGGEFRCPTSGGSADTTSTMQKQWLYGTCCNEGGSCLNPARNKDRHVIEYGLPTGVTAEDAGDASFWKRARARPRSLSWTWKSPLPLFATSACSSGRTSPQILRTGTQKRSGTAQTLLSGPDAARRAVWVTATATPARSRRSNPPNPPPW